jgi:hypothetical protein
LSGFTNTLHTILCSGIVNYSLLYVQWTGVVRGKNGLLCHLKRRLSELTQDQVNTRNTYHNLILGEGDIFDDSDVDENSDENRSPIAESSDDDSYAF